MGRDTQSSVQSFVRASALLTGFSAFELFGTGQAQAYMAWVEQWLAQHLPESADALTRIIDIVNQAPEDDQVAYIRGELMSQPIIGDITRSLIKLWYLGQWDDPRDPSHTVIPSPEAYTNGLVWQAISAHPQAAKSQGFGAWAMPPEEVSL